MVAWIAVGLFGASAILLGVLIHRCVSLARSLNRAWGACEHASKQLEDWGEVVLAAARLRDGVGTIEELSAALDEAGIKREKGETS